MKRSPDVLVRLALVSLLFLFSSPALAQSSDLIITWAGTGISGYSGDGNPARLAALWRPEAVVFDSQGNAYIADASNGRIRKISPGGIISTLASTWADGLAFDRAGNLYVAGSNKVSRVGADGTLTAVAGTGQSGFGGDGGPATSAKLYSPNGLAFDAAGNLYIADTTNHRVRKVDASGTITTVAGTGTAGTAGRDGPAINAQLNGPWAVAVDPQGLLCMADGAGGFLRVTATGVLESILADSNATGVAFDSAGRLYLASYALVRRVESDGTVTVIAGGGSNTSPDGRPATEAKLTYLWAVAFDAQDRLYVTQSSAAQSRVWRVQPPSTNNPVPALNVMMPAHANVGGPDLTLRVFGSNFVPGAVVRWQGADRPTVFVTSTNLEAKITAADIAASGSVAVAVFNPTTGGGGGESTALQFNVVTPAPNSDIIETVGGTGIAGYSGEGGQFLYSALNGPYALAFDAAGALYVADNAPGQARILKVTPDGTVITFAGGAWQGPTDGAKASEVHLDTVGGIAFDSAGRLYMAEPTWHRIYRIDPDGRIFRVAGTGNAGYSGDGGPAGDATLNYPNSLFIDPADNIYIADTDNNRIRKIDSQGIITTVAGNGIKGFFSDGLPALSSSLAAPIGVLVDRTGSLYIAEGPYDGCGRVRRTLPDGTLITVVAPGTSQTMNYDIALAGLVSDAAGNVYSSCGFGTSAVSNTVRIVSPDGLVTAVAGTGGSPAYSGDGGPPTAAQLACPLGIAKDLSSRLFIADTCNYRVRRITPAASSYPTPVISELSQTSAYVGGAAFTLKVLGSGFVSSSRVQWNGAERTTTLISPDLLVASIPASDIADVGVFPVTVSNPTTGGGGGNSNSLNFSVILPPPPATELIVTIAGTGEQDYSGEGLALNQAVMPRGLAFDAAGNLYAADKERIRKISPSGLITTFAGGGTNLSGDGGLATSAKLGWPYSLAFDAFGSLYFVDSGANKVRKITPGGILSTIAGTGDAGFSGDGGLATAATFSRPTAIAVDTTGNVYVGDSGNSRVRKIDSTGTITTVAGNGVHGYFGDGGPAVASPMGEIGALAVDAQGTLFIANIDAQESGPSWLQELRPDGTLVTLATPCGDASANTRFSIDALVIDGHGDLFVGCSSSNYLYSSQVLKIHDGIVTLPAGIPGYLTTRVLGDGGLATDAYLSSVTGLALDAQGNIYVADVYARRIRRIQAPPTASGVPMIDGLQPPILLKNNEPLTVVVNGSGFVPGAIVRVDGVNQQTNFVSSTRLTVSLPYGAVAQAGIRQFTVLNPLVAGGGGASNAVQFTVLDATPPTATFASTVVAGAASGGTDADGIPATAASLKATAIAVDGAGNLYIAEAANNRIRKMLPDGTITTFAALLSPNRMIADGAGNLYVSQTAAGANRVVKVTPDGTALVVAGAGPAGFGGDGGPAAQASLNKPAGLALDSFGNLYIADSLNCRVRKVDASGTITTVAGNGVCGFYGDGGPATTMAMLNPVSVALDGAGNLYITAGLQTAQLLRVDASGRMLKIAGGNGDPSPDGASAYWALLSVPSGMGESRRPASRLTRDRQGLSSASVSVGQ